MSKLVEAWLGQVHYSYHLSMVAGQQFKINTFLLYFLNQIPTSQLLSHQMNDLREPTLRTTSDLILIYYNFKGTGQIVRLLLFYLELPFTDIFIDQYEDQKSLLPPHIWAILQANPVNQSQLPAIIHEGMVIYELNQIMTYLCRMFNREDLLGVSIQQKVQYRVTKTQVCEIMEIYSQKIVPSVRFLAGYAVAADATQKEGVEFLSFVEEMYLKFLEESGYVMELALYLLKQEEQQFVFGNLTVIDFYNILGARQTLSLFGSIDHVSASSIWTETAKQYEALKLSRGKQVQKVDILRALKKYDAFFSSQQFYIKNETYLENFKVFHRRTPANILNGIRRVWATEMKFLHD